MSDLERTSRHLDDVARTLLAILDVRYEQLTEMQRMKIRKVATGALGRAVKLRQLQQTHPSIDWIEKTYKFLGAASRLILDLTAEEFNEDE